MFVYNTFFGTELCCLYCILHTIIIGRNLILINCMHDSMRKSSILMMICIQRRHEPWKYLFCDCQHYSWMKLINSTASTIKQQSVFLEVMNASLTSGTQTMISIHSHLQLCVPVLTLLFKFSFYSKLLIITSVFYTMEMFCVTYFKHCSFSASQV